MTETGKYYRCGYYTPQSKKETTPVVKEIFPSTISCHQCWYPRPMSYGLKFRTKVGIIDRIETKKYKFSFDTIDIGFSQRLSYFTLLYILTNRINNNYE